MKLKELKEIRRVTADKEQAHQYLEVIKGIQESDEPFRKMALEVIDSIGLDSIQDVNNYGIDVGYGGFIYYSDTIEFAEKHRKAIIAIVSELSKEFEETEESFISSLNCFKNMDHISRAYYSFVYNDSDYPEYDEIANGLSWLAAEHVCRMFSI
jgi:hypothetical protein